MKNVKIQCFAGKFMMSIGKSNVILTGWEDDTHLFCERFIIFEGSDGVVIFKNDLNYVIVKQYKKLFNDLTKHEELLESFMFDYGKKIAESDIFNIALSIMSKKGVKYGEAGLDVNLSPWTYQACLMYIKWKSIAELEKIQNLTRSQALKDMITLTKSVSVSNSDEKE